MACSSLRYLFLYCFIACSGPAWMSCAGPAGTLEPVADEAWSTRLAARPPAAEIEALASLAGDWQVQLEDSRPGADPQLIAGGRASIEACLGAHFLTWEVSFFLADRTVEAHGLLGFDADAHRYQFLWLSELAPGMRLAQGRGDPARGIVLEIAERDPKNGALLRARSVLRVTDSDHFELSQFALDAETGDWMPRQLTRYTRISSVSD
jgi:hypothetical protein